MMIYKVYIDNKGNYCISGFNLQTRTIIADSTTRFSTSEEAEKEHQRKTRIFRKGNSLGRWLSIRTREKYGYNFKTTIH